LGLTGYWVFPCGFQGGLGFSVVFPGVCLGPQKKENCYGVWKAKVRKRSGGENTLFSVGTSRRKGAMRGAKAENFLCGSIIAVGGGVGCKHTQKK